MIACKNSRPFALGQNVMALSCFAPDFRVGSVGKVTSRENGRLAAIQTPSGAIFKWFTIFELESVNPEIHDLLDGNYAYVNTDRLGAATLARGTRVQIIKIIEDIDYYEIEVNNRSATYRVTGIDITKSQ